MAAEGLSASAVAMRPFLPAKDFRESQRFYAALGFTVTLRGERIAHVQLGATKSAPSFLLQDFYTKDFAENCMMQLVVSELDEWWQHIASLNLAENFAVRPPRPPKLEPWGMRVAYLWDPAGVLWHIAAAA
ncbi:glyoxalase [Rhodoligotrophos defluvii]|uniref:glyoxalase n=1 Tax=Rhodoligotrophos defluvii TaxID=2561934 RepID=UPI001960115C|nr:glyoxalase [Rhodoligotrophos defluvii]